VGDLRGMGGLWTVELARDRLTKVPIVPVGATGDANAPMTAFAKACIDRNLVPLVLGNRINVAPPLNLSDADASTGLVILDEALAKPTRTWPNPGSTSLATDGIVVLHPMLFADTPSDCVLTVSLARRGRS
jgi:hypothetical protein